MRKSIFIIAAIIAATSTNAQGIVLEKIINSYLYDVNASSAGVLNAVQVLSCNVQDFDDCIFMTNEKDIIWWDETYTEHTIRLAQKEYHAESIIAARNIFTTDGVMCFFCPTNMYIINELGNIVYDFHTDFNSAVMENYGRVHYLFGEYKLFVCVKIDGQQKTYIYSLPGHGQQESSSSVISSPQRSARKVARNEQVLVETENNTYTLTGQQLK